MAVRRHAEFQDKMLFLKIAACLHNLEDPQDNYFCSTFFVF